MLPGNMLLVAGNMLPVYRQHVSLCIQQQTGNKLATILLPAMPATSNMLPGNMLLWCKRGFTDCTSDTAQALGLNETNVL